MFKSMTRVIAILSVLLVSLLSHAGTLPATVTFANGTMAFPQNGTGTANYIVHVDGDVKPASTALIFTASIPAWATQITSGTSACTGTSICANPFSLSAGQSCCLMLSLEGAQLDAGSLSLAPQVITTPSTYNSYAAAQTVTVTSPEYTVGGMISGLTGTVTLLNNETNALTTSTDGNYTFTTSLTDGSAYAVTVQTQPLNQTCSVSNATGTISGANVTNVTVTCATNAYTVGGTISGLSGTVVLLNNSVDSLTRSSDGSFTFTTSVAQGSPYVVTVQTQPNTQTCTVSNGTGNMGSNNVTNVTVTCATNSYTVGGMISGLSGTVVLQNNGVDSLSQSSDGAFTFTTPVAQGSPYAVTVQTQPSTQTCTVSNGTGNMGGVDVTNVGVACVSNTTTISVPATGTIPATLGGLTTNTVTVTNNGGVAATNVRAILPDGWSGVTQNSISCATIDVNDTCNLVFSSTTPYVAEGGIVITGDNITSPPPTMALAFTIQDYLVWAVSGSEAQVIDTTDLALTPWGNFVVTNAQSLTNGFQNTSKIQSTSDIGTSAAVNCYNSTVGGASVGTWYLPAICQMGGSGQGAGCVTGTANIDTNLVQLGFGGLSGFYWSSNEFSGSPTGLASYENFSSGGGSGQGYFSKSISLGVRCSRALTL